MSVQVRVEGCEIATWYDDHTAVVKNERGRYDVRQVTIDPDNDVRYIDQYTVGGGEFDTEAEAWAYASGYDDGARENM